MTFIKRLLFVALLALASVGLGHGRTAIAGGPWHCPCDPSQAPINLLANPGVDDGPPSPTLPTGWSTWAFDEGSAIFAWDDAVSRSGSRSARVGSATPNDALFQQTLAVDPFTSYVLTGWIKTEGVTHTAELVDAGANLSLFGGFVRSQGIFGTQDWTLVTLPFNSGSDTEVTIAARLGFFAGTASGTAWFDDLQLLAGGDDLLTNGGFEEGLFVEGGVPAAWAPEIYRGDGAAFAWDDAVYFSGGKSVRIGLPTPGAAAWTQTVLVRPHTWYRISGEIKTAGVSGHGRGAGAHLAVDERHVVSDTLRGTRGFRHVEETFYTAGREKVTFAASLGAPRHRATGTAWFDALRIAPVGPIPNPRWRVLGLIYPSTDFAYTDDAGVDHHVVSAMTGEEIDRAAAALRRFFGADVPALTGGEMYPSLTIRSPDAPLSDLDAFGGTFWPSPVSTGADLDPEFDAVFVIWDPSGVDLATGQEVSLAGFGGLTSPRGLGQTYATAIIEAISDDQRNVLKHEWGHSILFYHDAAGVAPTPAVDNHINDTTNVYVHCGTGEGYVLVDETDDDPILGSVYSNERGFTRDYYSGRTARPWAPGACLGITPAAWHAGGPVTKLPPSSGPCAE